MSSVRMRRSEKYKGYWIFIQVYGGSNGDSWGYVIENNEGQWLFEQDGGLESENSAMEQAKLKIDSMD